MAKTYRPESISSGKKTLIRLAFVLLALSACQLAQKSPSQLIVTDPPQTNTPVPVTPSPTIPSATKTPTATSTNTATSTPVVPKKLYEENFEDNVTCFKLQSLDKSIELGIINDAYSVQIEGNNSFTTQCIGGYDNFVLEYDVQIIDGDVHSIFGLRYRTYLGSSYNIYITGENALCWDYYDADSDTFRNLAGCWAVLPEEFDITDNFRITLVAAQENMAILIDGELMTAVSDRANDYGTFGFFIANNGPGKTKVIIDNIYIRELQQEDTNVFRFEQTGY